MMNTPTEDLIAEIIKTKPPGDNIPYDKIQEHQIIDTEMADFLISEAARSGWLVPSLMIGTFRTKDDKIILKLPKPIPIRHNGAMFEFLEYYISIKNQKDEPLHGLYIDNMSQHCTSHKLPFDTEHFVNMPNEKKINFAEITPLAQREYNKQRLSNYIRELVAGKDITALLRNLGHSRFKPCDARKLNSRNLRRHIFNKFKKASPELTAMHKEFPRMKREKLLEGLIRAVIQENYRSLKWSKDLFKVYGNWLVLSTPCKNEYGEIEQVLFRVFDYINGCKLTVPMSCYSRAGQSLKWYLCIPSSSGQKLIGLENFASEEYQITIIVDDPFLRAAYEHLLPQYRWVSYYCDPGSFEQVDWSPLAELEGMVALMLTNHSGKDMADIYIWAKALSDFLKEQYDLTVRYFQAPIDYPERIPFCENVGQMISQRLDQPPQVLRKCVALLESDQFEKNVAKAVESKSHQPFWALDSEKAYVAPKETKEVSAIDNILCDPFFLRCALTILFGEEGSAKTPTLLQLLAAIVAGVRPFKGKAFKSVYQTPIKVLVFLSEGNSPAEVMSNVKDHVKPYFTGDKEGLFENFIIEAIDEDLTGGAGQEAVMSLIEKHRNTGIANHYPDIIAFDVYKEVVGGRETSSTFPGFKSFLKKIFAITNAAVAVTDHEASGECKGFQEKRGYASRIFRISRPQPGSLCDIPVKIEAYKKLRGYAGTFDSFEYLRSVKTNKMETVIPGLNQAPTAKDFRLSELESFERLVTAYTRKGYSKEVIYNLLGMSSSTFADWIKTYRELTDKKL